MSVTLFWIVSSPCQEVSNSTGLFDSIRNAKLLGSSKFTSRDSRSIRATQDKRKRMRFCSLNADMNYACVGQPGLNGASNFPLLSNVLANPATGEVAVSSEQKVYEVVLKQASLVKRKLSSTGELKVKPDITLPENLSLLSEAYDRCREVCAEYAKTFYLGTLLMTPERPRAIWAIYGSKILYVAKAQKKAEHEQILHNQFEEKRKEQILKYKELNIYVKNINDNVNDEELRDHFVACGTIISTKVMRDDGDKQRIWFCLFLHSRGDKPVKLLILSRT